MSKRKSNIVAVVILAITLTYGLFQGRVLIDGPKLHVLTPHKGETVHTTLVEVSGETEHVTEVQVNGKVVTMDTAGNFTKTLVTPNGYGSILVEATDRFGHHTHEVITLYGEPINS